MYRKRDSSWKYLWVVIPLGIIGAIAWWLLSPLWVTNEVNESLPTSVIAANPTAIPLTNGVVTQPLVEAATQPPVSTEQILAQGSFYNLVHLSSGEALIYQLVDGSRILHLQNFSVDNGPDLYIYLVPIDPVSSEFGSEISGAYSLGKLKGNVGDQNYEIPADLDLSQYKSVVIWCQAFAVPFSAAPLTAQ